MNKKTYFPDLLEYLPTSYYDEFKGEYYENSFIKQQDLKRCIMTVEDERAVHKGICPRCGNSVFELEYGVFCKDCEVFYQMKDIENS